MTGQDGAQRGAWQGWGVVCDFDGTITMRDTAWMMLHVFAAPGWRHWEEVSYAGTITDQEAVTRQFELVSTPIPELRAWALDNAVVRPGAHEFFAWCAEHHLPVTVASNGLDFYIEAILKQFNLPALDVVCGHAEQRPGWIAVSYDHLWDSAHPGLRDQKLLAVRRLRERGLKVIYIGDGVPDYAAAASADVIFARYLLLERCRQMGTPCRPFEDFFDVLDAFRNGTAFTTPTQ
jgi:2-hydroxy-3-keto-5-methylthiopentenyl-1-phosphate phosphatase